MGTGAGYSPRIVDAYTAVSRHVVAGARGRAPAWPFSILETTIFYSKFFSKELIDVMKGLEAQGYGTDEIARLFYGPSAVSHWLYLAGFPFEGLSREDVLHFIERTIDIVSFWRRTDPFCLEWRNAIWTNRQARESASRPGFLEPAPDGGLAKVVGRINMVAWQYCLLLQIGHRNYSHEFHGPYDLENGESLFVREYFNLRPSEIWAFATHEAIPFQRMTIIEAYEGLEIKVDMFNHMLASSSLTPHLRRVMILVDDSIVSNEKRAGDLLDNWIGIIARANEFVRGYSKEDWVRKVIEMKYWLLRHQKRILGRDWGAPAEVVALAGDYASVEEMSGRAIRGQIARMKGYSEEDAIANITQMYLDNIYEGKMYF